MESCGCRPGESVRKPRASGNRPDRAAPAQGGRLAAGVGVPGAQGGRLAAGGGVPEAGLPLPLHFAGMETRVTLPETSQVRVPTGPHAAPRQEALKAQPRGHDTGRRAALGPGSSWPFAFETTWASGRSCSGFRLAPRLGWPCLPRELFYRKPMHKPAAHRDQVSSAWWTETWSTGRSYVHSRVPYFLCTPCAVF